MGMTVLYIAFGLVAFWLLGEVLLQYKARLRWRALAFVGFLSVVIGVVLPSVIVIVIGAIAFAVGQTYVTMSFRRGFTTGWALGGRPGESRRRKGDPGRASARQEPTLEVSGIEYEPSGVNSEYEPSGAPGAPGAPQFADQPAAASHDSEPLPPEQPPSQVYAPEPLPEDTGQYGVYADTAGYGGHPDQGDGAGYGYDPAYGYPPAAAADTTAYAAAGSGTAPDGSATAPHQGPGGGEYGYDGYTTGYGQQYGYDVGQQMYTSWVAEPYGGGDGAPGDGTGAQDYGPEQYQQQYEHHDQYGQQAYPQPYPVPEPYPGGAYSTDTPPGGVWMPQQRATEAGYGGELPPEQPYPYQGQDHAQGAHDPSAGYDPGTGYDPGYHDQQRHY